MKRIFSLPGLLAVCLTAAAIFSQPLSADTPSPQKGDVCKSDIVITAKHASHSFAVSRTTYEGEVKATDGEFTLTADHMIVEFTTESGISRIVASGNVCIVQPGTQSKATSNRADYAKVDVDGNSAQTITLSENPILFRPEGKIIDAAEVVYSLRTRTLDTLGGTPKTVIYQN